MSKKTLSPSMAKDNLVYIKHILDSIEHFDIRMDLVWETAIQDLPSLKPQLISLLENTNQ